MTCDLKRKRVNTEWYSNSESNSCRPWPPMWRDWGRRGVMMEGQCVGLHWMYCIQEDKGQDKAAVKMGAMWGTQGVLVIIFY